MTLHVKVSGAWKEVSPGGGLSAKVSGVWKEVHEGYVKVSGAWKMFYQSFVVTLSGEVWGTGSTRSIRFNTDGTVDRSTDTVYSQIDSATDWVIPNGAASSLFEIMATSGAELPDAGPALGVWHDLGTTREWGHGGSPSCNLTISIRYNGGATLDSANYIF